MSLSPDSRCDHNEEACKLYLADTVKHLRDENIRLAAQLHEECIRPRTMRENFRGVKAPTDQRDKLLDQVYRWKALYERERHRRWALKNQIMKVYGTLDFHVETGAIVDVNAKSMAEYVSVKLRELIRNSAK